MLQLAGTESVELCGILNIYLTLKEAKIQRSQETYVWLKRKKQTNKQTKVLTAGVSIPPEIFDLNSCVLSNRSCKSCNHSLEMMLLRFSENLSFA